jgi:tetratricopeptide (TPR) repeat protein
MRAGSSYGIDAPTVAPNESLLRGITRETKARRAAALRLAEKGRMLLQKKQYQKSVAQLEQALSLDANPFIYYYLAKGHYYLGNSDRASGFLAAAEAGLVPDAWWMDEFVALRSDFIPAGGATARSETKCQLGFAVLSPPKNRARE